jgi:dynein intermediate chain 1
MAPLYYPGSIKHSECINQIKWSTDTKLNLYSISSDGKILNWYLIKNTLQAEEVYKLSIHQRGAERSKSSAMEKQYQNGLCFDFNPKERYQMIVGTEEGNIHLCSCAY